MWKQDEQPRNDPRAAASSPPPQPERRTTAWIGKAVTIRGDLVASEDLVIDGQVEGRIDLQSQHLTVGASGTIRTDVTARIVTIRGRVIGNITASERLEILETGSVEGNVAAPRFVMVDGAVLHGKVNLNGSGT